MNLAHSPKPPSPTALRVAVTIVHPVAILCTAFRLGYRYTRLKFWWDDALAGLSMVLDAVSLVSIWMLTDNSWAGPLHEPMRTRKVAYWLASLTFNSVLWSARLSILYSIMRITPTTMTLRRVTYAMAVLFGLMYASIIIQKVYFCVHDGRWQTSPILQCHLGKSIAITELTTDCVADVVLVAIPWGLMSRLRLPRAHRKLLLTVFSASIVTTAVSIPHAVFVLGPEGLLSDITAHIEAGVSLIVANMLVLVTYVYKAFMRGQGIDDPGPDPVPVDAREQQRASLPHMLDPQASWTRSTILNTYDLQQIGQPVSESEVSRPGSRAETVRVGTSRMINVAGMAGGSSGMPERDAPLRRDVFDDGSSMDENETKYS
ncbi:hypothetical protein OE88DRAFT_1736872 [Heliocybe sulcata]|uniref:Rhodopsin domain-containing protein n=1 Tax=Heliocybe sulcata TaxID=5364 RepID=A0A5C3MZL2_9AGAM|nr:hypothetical protein OE88DRAFT_1736872 [Heliocybe sulcata]